MSLFRKPGMKVITAVVAIAVPIIAWSTGHPAVAEVVGGGLIVAAAVLAAAILTRRAAFEDDPRTVLALDVVLVLVVVFGLAGISVIGLALPRPVLP